MHHILAVVSRENWAITVLFSTKEDEMEAYFKLTTSMYDFVNMQTS